MSPPRWASQQRWPSSASVRFLLVASLLVLTVGTAVKGDDDDDDDDDDNDEHHYHEKGAVKPGVTYDGRSLIINGKRELIFSGSIHYPRVPLDMWDDVIEKAKDGGLNCIQTYVFWNVHEPRKGEFDFTGNKDLVKFIKKLGEHGLYATLRLGPFIQAEWNHGGLPYWLREEERILFRTNNDAYKTEMERWFNIVVKMMKDNKLYASEGGPIILSQVENEYDHIRAAYKENGKKYVKWAASMALGLNIGVPWLMCKSKDAPGEVINACNGRHCGDTFAGPNHPSKPQLWTENWTAQYRNFGDPPSQRSAEDIAFAVARWFSRNGSHVNYYMYYGGTNYGRTAASYVTTRYYDEAPIDEFGFVRDPKYSHLKDLHYALALSRAGLLWGRNTMETYTEFTEARIYEKPEKKVCVAFLANNHTRNEMRVKFRGEEYVLPSRSISILPDCKTVVYNTKRIVSQHSARKFVKSKIVHSSLKWEMMIEKVPNTGSNYTTQPLEQFFLTKDKTDYVWYMTSVEMDADDLPFRKSIQPVLSLRSLGHAILVFVNGRYAGTAHGFKRAWHFDYDVPTLLKEGSNDLAFLQVTTGMPDSGTYMEHRFTGLRTLVVEGLDSGTLDLTANGWRHQVGLDGENLNIYAEEGQKNVKWVPATKGLGPPITWYRAYFDAPEGDGPLAIRLDNMTKGMVWVNGNSIGRYWTTFLTPLHAPSQNEYHIPRSFLKPKHNLIVIFDEAGGIIDTVEIKEVTRDQKCSWVRESYPPHVRSWKRENKLILPVKIGEHLKPKSFLRCSVDQKITAIEFASFGEPWGICGLYKQQECHSPLSRKIVEERCLGKSECKVPVDRELFKLTSEGACKNVTDMALVVQVRCGNPNN